MQKYKRYTRHPRDVGHQSGEIFIGLLLLAFLIGGFIYLAAISKPTTTVKDIGQCYTNGVCSFKDAEGNYREGLFPYPGKIVPSIKPK